jgi:hypothetical protein
MPLVKLTYARVTGTVLQGETRYLRIVVQTDTGEADMGLIEDTGFVMADGLLVGMWVNGEFKPFGAGTIPSVVDGGGGPGPGGGASLRAIVTGRTNYAQDKYRYNFIEATGAAEPDEWVEKDGGVEGVFYSPLEGGGGVLHSGINRDNLVGFSPVPIEVGATVVLVSAAGAWYLSSIQAIDGSCGGE